MDNLFFDIECADGHNICSFGYVITDERFNITEEKDILIDPKCEFKLGRSGFDGRIHLAYPPQKFREYPDFAKQYKDICALLSAPERTLWGHAIASDIEYLDIACDRYGKKRFDISVYDTQRIYAGFRSSAQSTKLEKIMEECEIDVSALTAHNSRDDAKMSMLTVKKICEYKNCGLKRLISQSGGAIVDRSGMEKAYRHRALKKSVERCQGKYRSEYKAWQSVYIADVVDKLDVAVAENIINTVYNNCYRFVLSPHKCDYYVTDDVVINDGQAENAEFKAISFAELSDMLGVDIDRNGNITDRAVSVGSSFGELLEKALKNKKIAQ